MTWLMVALGGACGAMARHGVGVLAVRLMGHGFPWGTLTVNIAGSFIMGLSVVMLAHVSGSFGLSQEVRSFLVTGFLGAFTTFSTFALDVASLYDKHQLGLAAVYVGISVIGAIGGLMLGRLLLRSLLAG